MRYKVNEVRRIAPPSTIRCGKCGALAVYCNMRQTTGGMSEMPAPGFYYYCEACLPNDCEPTEKTDWELELK